MIFSENIKAILETMWPTILILSVVAFSMRITYIIKNKTNIVLYKDLMFYLFFIYIICLFYVVTFQDVSWSSSNYIPFKEILRYEFGSRMFFKNVIGNMVMFIPFGLFVSYFLKLEKIYSISILSLITSISIEVIQLIIGRVFDIDDIILNLLGSIIGFYLYNLVHKLRIKLPDFLKKDIIYNIITIIFAGGLIIYVIKILN